MDAVSSIPVVGTILKTIEDYAVKALFRQLGYLFCYKSLVEETSSEIRNIEFQEGTVFNRVEAAKADGKTIRNQVTEWQDEAHEISTCVQASLQRGPSCNCFGHFMFPNPVNRFRLGRKAAHELPNLAKLRASGESILAAGDEIAIPSAEQNIPKSDTTYQNIGSRREAYQKLWDALVKENGHPIIGICGMAGVGKTHMMEVACTNSIKEKVFDTVIRADLGAGDIDVINIQKQLAECLDCHLNSQDNMQLRATQLNRSITNVGKKTLVILDNVWERIQLADIGIALADGIPKGCKILFTSRNEYVCLDNGCQDPIKITVLTDIEAWDMFIVKLGTRRIYSFQDKSLAWDVCKACGALPLLIHAVADALKSVSDEDSWKLARSQLQSANFPEIDRINQKAYNCILWSFNQLKGPTKTCLLLCSLFREDAEIDIDILSDFARGLQLLYPGGNIRGLVHNLKSASLLLEGKTRHTVKIHDVIRDVARYIAVRDKEYAFLFISHGLHFQMDNYDYSTLKLLQFVESRDDFKCHTDMVCPNLHTLWLESNNKPQPFSDSFFRAISSLKIMLLKGMHIFPAQNMAVQSFGRLTVLILDGCDLKEMPPSIFSGNLEILGISKCLISIPLDLTMLKSLKTLKVLSETEIEMVPNSISSLSGTLKELHIPRGFKFFDAEGMRSVPISSELNKLTVLTSLKIQLRGSESWPDRNIVDNLLQFYIEVDDRIHYSSGEPRLTNTDMTFVSFTERCVEGVGEALVERAEIVKLVKVEGSANGFSSRHPQAYSDMKVLHITDCKDIQHLARITHDEIQQSHSLTSFSQLTRVTVISCCELKYLFCCRAAKCLEQLEVLTIMDCDKLEVVIRNESGNDGVINFPKLKSLRLHSLQSLIGFYEENRSTSSSSTTIMDNASTSTAGCNNSLFSSKVEFPALETLTISSLNTSEIWGKNCDKNDSFYGLKNLKIWKCHKLKFVIPLAMLPQFQNLEELHVHKCDSVISKYERSNSLLERKIVIKEDKMPSSAPPFTQEEEDQMASPAPPSKWRKKIKLVT